MKDFFRITKTKTTIFLILASLLAMRMMGAGGESAPIMTAMAIAKTCSGAECIGTYSDITTPLLASLVTYYLIACLLVFGYWKLKGER